MSLQSFKLITQLYGVTSKKNSVHNHTSMQPQDLHNKEANFKRDFSYT